MKVTATRLRHWLAMVKSNCSASAPIKSDRLKTAGLVVVNNLGKVLVFAYFQAAGCGSWNLPWESPLENNFLGV